MDGFHLYIGYNAPLSANAGDIWFHDTYWFSDGDNSYLGPTSANSFYDDELAVYDKKRMLRRARKRALTYAQRVRRPTIQAQIRLYREHGDAYRLPARFATGRNRVIPR